MSAPYVVTAFFCRLLFRKGVVRLRLRCIDTAFASRSSIRLNAQHRLAYVVCVNEDNDYVRVFGTILAR